MIANVLRMAGQRLLPIIAPAGAKQFAREAAQGAALNLAVEQGLPLALGQEGRPLPESILRSASIGLLGGPAERVVVGGAKRMFPGLSTLEGRATQRLAGMGVPAAVATGAAGLAASAGKLGLGTLGQVGLVEPISTAVTRTVFPEGFGGGRNMQTGMQADIAGATVAPQLAQGSVPTGPMDPAEIEHRRKLDLIYARNYKFPSYIHHVSQATQNPFEIANQMVNVPTVNYF
jgi:hypothetical protein